MRPPVVAYFVIKVLSSLLEITRDLLCTALDAFPGDHEFLDVQEVCVRDVYAFWRRLSLIAASICKQITERLLSRDRLLRFGVRFRPDAIIWSHIIRFANTMFVNGWFAPLLAKKPKRA
jgi:hypothetical protein